jgi:hypothetical protein
VRTDDAHPRRAVVHRELHDLRHFNSERTA